MRENQSGVSPRPQERQEVSATGPMDVHPGATGTEPRKRAQLAGLERAGGSLEAGPQERGPQHKAPAKLNFDLSFNKTIV